MAESRRHEPGDLLGVYRELGDVPDRHRLRAFAEAYEGRDAWHEWYEARVLPECHSEHGLKEAERHERCWKAHMDGRRHHALATPADVDDYCGALLDAYSESSVAKYFRRVASFYGYLVCSTGHPHVYSPVLMAAAADGPASEAWGCER
jgi:hypothetical protein